MKIWNSLVMSGLPYSQGTRSPSSHTVYRPRKPLFGRVKNLKIFFPPCCLQICCIRGVVDRRYGRSYDSVSCGVFLRQG